MPNVPTLNTGNVGIASVTGGEQSANATAESFGAGDARNLGRLATGVTQSALAAGQLLKQVEAENRDTRVSAVVAQAETEMLTEMNKIYAKTGYDSTNALNDSIEVSKAIKKKYGKSFTDAKEISAFEKRMASTISGHQNRAMGFGLQQMKKFRRDTAEAQISNATQLAVHAKNDKRQIAKSERDVEDAMIEFVTGKKVQIVDQPDGTTERIEPSLTKEEKALVDKKKAEAVHNMYNEVMDNISQDSPEAALSFLQENQEKFLPSQYDQLVKTMDQRADSDFMNKNVDEAAASGEDLAGVEAYADKLSKGRKPEVVRKFRQLAKQRFGELQDIEKMESKRALHDQYNQLVQNPVSFQVPDSLPPREQEFLRSVQRKLNKEERAKNGIGPAAKTNYAVFNQLRNMPFNKFAEAGFLESKIDSLSGTDFKQLLNERAAGRPKYHQQASQMAKRAIDSILDTSNDTGGFLGFGKEDPVFGSASDEFSRQREQNFYNEFYRRLGDVPQNEVNQQKVQEVIDDMLKPINTTPGLFETDTIVFQYEAILQGNEEAVIQDALDNIPSQLKKFGDNLNYDSRYNAYVVQSGDVRDLYDQEGNFLRRQVKNKKPRRNQR